MISECSVEPGAQVVVPVTLNALPGMANSAYTIVLLVRLETPLVEVVDWEPVTPEGLPPYAEAANLGIRVLRNAARDRQLASWRKIGSMGRPELLDLLYQRPVQPPAPVQRAEVPVVVEVVPPVKPARVGPYARIGNGRVLHRGKCPKVLRARERERAVEEMSKAGARKFGLTPGSTMCADCNPEI